MNYYFKLLFTPIRYSFANLLYIFSLLVEYTSLLNETYTKEKRDSSERKTWRLTLDEFTEIHNIFQKGIFEVSAQRKFLACPESENFAFDSYKLKFRLWINFVYSSNLKENEDDKSILLFNEFMFQTLWKQVFNSLQHKLIRLKPYHLPRKSRYAPKLRYAHKIFYAEG